MRNRKLFANLSFAAILLTFTACEDIPDNQNSGNNSAGDSYGSFERDTSRDKIRFAPDTIVYVDARGIRDSFKLKNWQAVMLDVAMKIAANYPNGITDTTVVEFTELNGKSGAEKAVSHCKMKGGVPWVIRKIYSGKEIIWNDSIEADTAQVFEIREASAALQSEFREELMWARALTYHPRFTYSPVPFIDDETTFYLQEERLLARGVDSTKAASSRGDYRRYLVNFRGRLLEIPSHTMSGLYLWYKPWEAFVEIWVP